MPRSIIVARPLSLILAFYLALEPSLTWADTSCTACSDMPMDFSQLDWYPDDSQPANLCKGSYQQPPLPDAGTDIPIELLPVMIAAEQGRSTLGQGTLLTGQVTITQGRRRLASNRVLYDQASGNLELTEGATYREPGLLLRGERALSNTGSMKTTIDQAHYVMHAEGIRGSVERITRNQDATLSIYNGSYTQCPPGDNSWSINAKTIHLNPNSGFGSAHHATLKAGNVPLLYLPYFYFPIDERRHTGFLYPTLKYSSGDGLDIRAPYYFNIAPHMDDTLTPRWVEKRGLMLSNEFRYMTRHSFNALYGAALKDDRKANRDRWLVGLKHTGQPGQAWRSEVDYVRVSDNDYLDDFSSEMDISELSHLNQRAALNYYGPRLQAELSLQSYQTIDDNLAPYRRLPELRITGQPTLWQHGPTLGYQASFTRFDRNLDGLSGAQRITGDRYHVHPQLSHSLHNRWGYLRPSLSVWHTRYQLDNTAPGAHRSPSVSAPIISLDSGIFLERDTQLFATTYQQTLEPRAYLLYVPYRDQQDIPDFDTNLYSFNYEALFRDNRFSGYDRLGDEQKISLGLTSRLYSQRGHEVFSASIGQAISFKDRKVSLPNAKVENDRYSDIATRVIWRPNQRLRFSFNGNFDRNKLHNRENNFAIRYQEDVNRIASFSYRFTEGVREQSTTSILWPINHRWSSLGLWQYDWLHNDQLDLAFGLEYTSCCWKTRLIARRWLDDNDNKSALYLQFVLKGLGSFGNNGGSDFIDKITGFEQREEHNAYF